MSRVLFLINGLGLGNSTRCHAIINRLYQKGAEIEVVTSGNGLWYFKSKKEITKLHASESLQYAKSHGRLSAIRTVFSFFKILKTVKATAIQVREVAAKFRPDVIVTDSEYSSFFFRDLGIPVVALNNSDVIIYSMKTQKRKPASILPQFYLVEWIDFLYHRWIPDLVISPTIDETVPGPQGKFKRVSPIARSTTGDTPLANFPAKKLVIMLSGSVFGTPVHLRRKYSIQVDIIGREKPKDIQNSAENVVYNGKIEDTLPLLQEADLVVVNGGFSAVSECFCLRKPMLIIPVPNHAEQWINAKTAMKLGVAKMANEDELEEAISDCLENLGSLIQAYQNTSSHRDGAEQAATAILESIPKLALAEGNR